MCNDNAAPHLEHQSDAEVAFRDFIDQEYPHLRKVEFADQLQTARNTFAFAWNAGIDHGERMRVMEEFGVAL